MQRTSRAPDIDEDELALELCREHMGVVREQISRLEKRFKALRSLEAKLQSQIAKVGDRATANPVELKSLAMATDMGPNAAPFYEWMTKVGKPVRHSEICKHFRLSNGTVSGVLSRNKDRLFRQQDDKRWVVIPQEGES